MGFLGLCDFDFAFEVFVLWLQRFVKFVLFGPYSGWVLVFCAFGFVSCGMVIVFVLIWRLTFIRF